MHVLDVVIAATVVVVKGINVGFWETAHLSLP